MPEKSIIGETELYKGLVYLVGLYAFSKYIYRPPAVQDTLLPPLSNVPLQTLWPPSPTTWSEWLGVAPFQFYMLLAYVIFLLLMFFTT